tara:strand:+ start:842 stop:1291 length:450 start_codon:yes stop_codon:yes gene_type:complete
MAFFPKDCFVCDHCNKALSDSNFIATEDSLILGQPACVIQCKDYVDFYISGESNKMNCKHILEAERTKIPNGVGVISEQTYCQDCQKRDLDIIIHYRMVVTMEIKKGMDCSKTILAEPNAVFNLDDLEQLHDMEKFRKVLNEKWNNKPE